MTEADSDIYRKDLLRLAMRAHGHGRLADADVTVSLDNPLCGDRVEIDVSFDGGAIAALAHEVRACALCQASISILGERARGLTRDDLATLTGKVAAMLAEDAPPPPAPWGDYAAFVPVRTSPSRHKCVLLPLEALSIAFDGNTP